MDASKDRVTLKALASFSPGFALKPWVQKRLPRVAKAQPWAGIGERFQRYLFSNQSCQKWVAFRLFVQSNAADVSRTVGWLLHKKYFDRLHHLSLPVFVSFPNKISPRPGGILVALDGPALTISD